MAQETKILLLDEPTTYLDLAHQLEILQLLEDLNRKQGRTIVMVIHELNNAARFADHMIAVKARENSLPGQARGGNEKGKLERNF